MSTKKKAAPKKAVVKKTVAPVKKPAVKSKPKVAAKPAAKPPVPLANRPIKTPVKVAAPAKKTVTKKRPTPKPPVVVKVATGKTVVAPAVSKIAQNGYTRPKPTRNDGTPKITHRVWAIADEISARHAADAKANKTEPKPATRQEVLTACEAEKIKYSTFSNQFYRWRKFNGLFGRVKKDGTPAKPLGKPGPRKAAKPAPKPLVATKPKPPVKPPVKTIQPAFPFMSPADASPTV